MTAKWQVQAKNEGSYISVYRQRGADISFYDMENIWNCTESKLEKVINKMQKACDRENAIIAKNDELLSKAFPRPKPKLPKEQPIDCYDWW